MPGTTQWTQEQLYAHLQMAINVEFFTIPLYLTAASSIQPAARETVTVLVIGENQERKPIDATFPVYDTIFSVAIEEMYHLMWICNVATSVGMPIQIPAPDMTVLPSQLNLPANIVSAYKGVANLADVIDLLVAIETPDPKYQYPADPNDPITKFRGPVKPQASYNSIGDLYHALSYGLNELFPQLHNSSYDAFQKIMISASYPNITVVTDIDSALNSVGAIVEQGEGTGVEGFIPTAYEPQAGNYGPENQFTHYERFLAVQMAIANITPHLYPTPASGDPTNSNQQSLTQNYSQLLQAINQSYTLQGTTLNTPGMSLVGVAIDALWAASLLPMWTYITPPPQTVPLELHVCQGLNTCAGHGANGSGTKAGDGDCATINHTCVGSNDCHSQGACGFPGEATVGGPNNVFTPGENGCKGLGGCETPISVWQVFSGGPLDGKYVWCEARQLFETRMTALNMPFGSPNVQPATVRQAKGTNPGSTPLPDNNSCPTSSSGAKTAASSVTSTPRPAPSETKLASGVASPGADQQTIELHICQGLNTCAGHGSNGSGTMAGDGDCATISHTCVNSNDCNTQGACGYAGQATVGGPSNVFTPGENACKGLGGCESPISVWQVFSGGPLNGNYVWCEARQLFEARMKALNMTYGAPSVQPATVRQAKGTNPGSSPLPNNTSCPS